MKYFKTLLLLFYLAFSAGLFSKSNQSSKYAYLGVYTSVLGEDVSYQLGLPANLHLSVEQWYLIVLWKLNQSLIF